MTDDELHRLVRKLHHTAIHIHIVLIAVLLSVGVQLGLVVATAVR